MTERKKFKSVIPDWVREESDQLLKEVERIGLEHQQKMLSNGTEVNSKRDWSIDAQINKRVEQYKHKYNKKPTYVVMSLPVHSVMMSDFRTAFEDEVVPADYRMNTYNDLEVIVLEVQDIILLVG
ncbi:hypothetical protein [Bacillus phage SBSphiJ5]|nr:hypothetical protein [Bacillus phage SBSphiJ5]